MDASQLVTFFEGGAVELRITLAVCSVALAAVLLPLCKGAALCWRALVLTRGGTGAGGPVSARVENLATEVAASADDQLAPGHSLPFVRDAARQLVVDDYETTFAQPISMYANLLPPIGFIGTTCGLAVLLVSMRLANDALQLGALALALSSTIFALVGYAGLEAMKIHLYGRLARAVDRGLSKAATATEQD